MKNKKSWMGILVMVLVFGMMVVGCNNSEKKLVGDWYHWSNTSFEGDDRGFFILGQRPVKSMDFAPNGTVEIGYDWDHRQGTWSVSGGKLLLNDKEEYDFDIKNGMLTITKGFSEIVFR